MQLHTQYRCVQAVEAAADAFHLVDILVESPVIGPHPDSANQIFVLTHDRSRITVRAEVLAWIKTEARRMSEGTRALSAPCRAVCLGGVLDHFQMVPASDLENRIHVAGLAVEMHGKDGARPRGNGGFDLFGIDHERVFLDVDEDGLGTSRGNSFRGRNERVGGRDHLVPGAEAERMQCQAQRVGSVRAACAIQVRRGTGGVLLLSAVAGKLELEVPDILAANERAPRDDTLERGVDFVSDAQILSVEVDEWNVHWYIPSPFNVTSRPPSRSDRWPASRIETTRRPCAGPVSGVCPVRMHSRKWPVSTLRGSSKLIRGRRTSPAR